MKNTELLEQIVDWIELDVEMESELQAISEYEEDLLSNLDR